MLEEWDGCYSFELSEITQWANPIKNNAIVIKTGNKAVAIQHSRPEESRSITKGVMQHSWFTPCGSRTI